MMEPEGAWESTLMELEGETVTRLDSINGRNKTAEIATETVRIGIRRNGGNETTATAAAQDWLVIRQQQQRDNSD